MLRVHCEGVLAALRTLETRCGEPFGLQPCLSQSQMRHCTFETLHVVTASFWRVVRVHRRVVNEATASATAAARGKGHLGTSASKLHLRA